MSWAQQRGPSRPNGTGLPPPPVQMFNPNQHSTSENQPTQSWYHFQQQQQQQPGGGQSVNNQSQQYWQQPPAQNYQPNVAGQLQRYPQADQTAFYQNSARTQQAYENGQYSQQYDQNRHYTTTQPAAQSASHDWEPFSWGDDDNSNMQPIVSQPQQPVAANNPIADSFVYDGAWNWSVTNPRPLNTDENNSRQDSNPANLFPTIADLKKTDNTNEATNRKLDTPQWSTESQPSVESSDDVLQTSESDKSHMVSRSSTISHSPLSGQESSPSGQGAQQDELLTISHHVENREIIKQDETRSSRVNPTPPLPKNVHTPPLLIPPQGGSSSSDNPYKRPLGSKPGTAFKSTQDFRQPPATFNQAVNLETLPDNSEHPDLMLSNPNVVKPVSNVQPWGPTENNEAPINDRNQYLETGQLSELNVTDSIDVDLGNDTLPPPGLQRLIPGQMEQNEIGRSDQPLPGFSRMVLGQNENTADASRQNISQFDLSGPPEGLHRMVPGESSSPETSLRQPNLEENDSEMEFSQLSQTHGIQPPRSATIGADTPPIQRQSLLMPAQPPLNTGAIGGDSETALNDGKSSKSNKLKERKEPQDNRREAVQGQTTDLTISNLTNAVRNLTVGENLTDGHTSNNSLTELSPRRRTSQESSESDSDRKKNRNHRDKRAEKSKSREKERSSKTKDRDSDRDRYYERNNDRYSPDPYREKRDRGSRRYRDRRYEEDTDYYSDKERRGREERDRDYERKYSSLKKDKDKRRKERDPRDYRGERDPRRSSNYYYNRHGEEYGEHRNSRPSSRSDSMHESYRERRREPDVRDRRPRDRTEREKERYRTREHREAYNPYQNFAYDPYNPYYQQYQYYENLRRTNPQAYAEWYRKYYQQAAGSAASFTGEDRASVHSGRSSANDELAKDRYTRQSFYSQSHYYGQSHSISGHFGFDTTSSTYNKTLDQTDNSTYYGEQPSIVQRLTPTKFSTAHIKGSINSGKLIRILPNYPMDGQNAVVDICNLQALLENDPNYLELNSFPGPLVKGVTHKKQIIEYCDSKIRGASYNREIVDVESYILMWELLILLIRQNGMVVGTDIAELLLKNCNSEPAQRPSSALSTTSSNVGEKPDISEASTQPISDLGSTQSILKDEEATKKFREYLLYGSCQEALEWAMKHGLWGHALFLASKLDKRTYANVMMRFANGLTINDPLQTLYQLLSGKLPAAVTCVAEEKWGDWRPHLAMILSNSTQRPELNCKAITQLGDTLLNRGSLFAAQFCYLMAQVSFGQSEESTTRLVLLGSDHRKEFPQFATNEAIHMTEIYEYACSLNNQEFYISEFQFYKYLVATRLADFGLLQRSLRYLESIAGRIIYNPSGMSPILVDAVSSLADRLKFYDPVGDVEDDESEFGAATETSRPDNSWLRDLKAIQNDLKSGKLVQEYNGNNDTTETTVPSDPTSYTQDVWQQEQQQYDQQQQEQFNLAYGVDQKNDAQVWSSGFNVEGHQASEAQQQVNSPHLYQEQQNYWAGQQTWNDPANPYGQDANQQQSASLRYFENSSHPTEEVQPQISMPHQPRSNKSAFDDDPLPHEKPNTKSSPQKVQPKSPKKESDQSTGWFGGIFSKLSMKPKNQMKLPEDKNPKIIWDETNKKWSNMDEDPNDAVNEFKPPPKMPMLQQPQQPQLPPAGTNDVVSGTLGFSTTDFSSSTLATSSPVVGPMSLPALGTAAIQKVEPSRPAQSNMFKMQKNRNVKNAYVDVFKQNGVKSHADSVRVPDQVPQMVAPSQMNFFIPQAVSDPNASVNFLTPGGALTPMGDSQMSRWSSSSSLSREVASYMQRSGPKLQAGKIN